LAAPDGQNGGGPTNNIKITRQPAAYLQSFRHLLLFVFGLDQETATTWPYTWFPELLSGAFCTIFRA
jgi:hypothetical protein